MHGKRDNRLGMGALVMVVAFLASSCTMWTFGRNNIGQLGNGTTTDSSSPVQAGTDDDWARGAQSRGDFSCGVKNNKTLWCWGWNSDGQLGNGSQTASTSPVQAGTDSDWAVVTTGSQHACATKTDGSLWCWGDQIFGQTGLGVFGGNTLSPTQVGVGTDWATASAGYLHTCAVKTDGTMWCWGAGGFGQLGNGSSFGQVDHPIQVETDTDWARIGTGDNHSCGIKTSGGLWCWGYNNAGQIGDGTLTERTLPVQIGTDTDWLAVSGGNYNTCAMKTATTAWCWGYNGEGAVGDGTMTDRLTPTQVGSSAGWSSLSNGNGHSCGINGGALFCWGTNFHGQLGDGTTTQRIVPTQSGSATDWHAVYAGFNMTSTVKKNS